MYGKLATLCVLAAYLIPIVVYIFRKKVSFYLSKLFIMLGDKKRKDFRLSDKTAINILIVIGTASAISALVGIVFGHYSRSESEGYGGGLSFILGLGYIYFIVVIALIYQIKNFSLSGYR